MFWLKTMKYYLFRLEKEMEMWNKIKKENVPLSCNFGTWQTLSEVRITVTCNLR